MKGVYNVYILKMDARQPIAGNAVAIDPYEVVGNEFHNPQVVKLGANKVERQNVFDLPRYGILRVNFSRVSIPDDVKQGWNPDLDLCQIDAEERAAKWRKDEFIELFGRKYVLLDQSSNGVKCAEAEFILENFRDVYLEWWHCGMELKGLDLHTRVEKDARALTTCLPHEYYFGKDGVVEELRGIIPPLDIDGMVIMPKVVTENHRSLEGASRLVNLTDGEVEGVAPGAVGITKAPWEETDSDGIIQQVIDNTKNDEYSEKVNELVEKGKLEGYTINGSGNKGSVNCVTKSSLIEFFEDEIKDGYIKEGDYERDENGNLVKVYLKDYWHRRIDILSATSIGTPDTFKWLKADDFKTYEGWLKFVEGWHKYGHSFDVSVVPHVVWRPMPYQMTMGLLQSKADADWMASKSISMLSQYKDPDNAMRLLPKPIREALQIYPALWQDEFVQFSAKAAYSKKRWAALSGKLDRMGHYYFVAPDTVGIFRAWCGDNRPYIQAGYIIQRGKKPGTKCTMSRNPFPGLNFCLRTRQNVDEKYLGLYACTSVYVSMLDDSMARMQADFDGDKCYIIESAEVYAMVENTLKVTGYLTVRWAKPDGIKTQFSWDVFWDHVLEARTSEVGLICAGIAKMRAVDSRENKDWETSTNYNLDHNAIGEAACTLDIDNAKGKGGKVQQWYAIMEAKKYRLAKRPLHMAYQKSSPCPRDDKALERKTEEFEKSKFYIQHLLDYATQMIECMSDKELYINIFPTEEFRYLRLTSDPKHTKGKAGLKDLLDDAIKEFNVEYARLCAATDNSMATSEFTRSYYEHLRVKILAAGAIAGMSQDETIDALIKTVYNGYQQEGFDISKQEKKFRILWTCFGDELVQNLQANLGISAEEIDITDAYEPSEEEEDFEVLSGDGLYFGDEDDGLFLGDED